MSRASIASPVTEVVEFFAHRPSREEIAAFRLSAVVQERLRDMIHCNSAGTLSPDEQHELDQMIVLDDVVSLIRARTQRAPNTSANILS
jgi:hypothetical protein